MARALILLLLAGCTTHGLLDVGATPEIDGDGDGFATNQDCDDADPAVHPFAPELCDGVDQDCDRVIDNGARATFYADGDGDGWGDPTTATQACAGATRDGGDCDDARADIHPDARETCDGIDNDCDTAVDEDGLSWWYADDDGDGYGDPGDSHPGCDPGLGSANADDCDDSDPEVSPRGTEVCDGVDNDCDGATDEGAERTWYIDYDRDGYGSDAYTVRACAQPRGYVATDDDCDDLDATVHPAATERCDDVDNDCDGAADEADAADATPWYADADGDGWGDASIAVVACDAPSGYAPDLDDCDDTDAAIHPGATEVCSLTVDQDCDGVTPELCASCLDHLAAAGTAADGLYTIDPDGASGSTPEIDVWCDMTTDGGGWTLVQRTLWDWSDTSLLQTGYADWYGTTLGDPDAGSVYRMAGETWALISVEHEILAVHVPRDGTSGADCAPLYYEGSKATFTITSTATSISKVSSSVDLTNAPRLSTADSGASRACVTDYDAVPWFYSYCCTTCPSFYGSYWTDEAHPMASYLDSTEDLDHHTDADVCPSGAAVTTYGYEGINEMALYLR